MTERLGSTRMLWTKKIFTEVSTTVTKAFDYPARRIAVVINVQSPASREIAEHYCKLRKVQDRILISVPDSAFNIRKESIEYKDYVSKVERKVALYISKNTAIDTLVLTKGIPIRIKGHPYFGVENSKPCLDATVATLGYAKPSPVEQWSVNDPGFTGTGIVNRFWNAETRWSARRYGGLLVSRLDGFEVAHAKNLVDHAIYAEQKGPSGTFLLDACPGFGFDDNQDPPVGLFQRLYQNGSVQRKKSIIKHATFNKDLRLAAAILKSRGIKRHLDESDVFYNTGQPLAGYCSWGSNDKKFSAPNYKQLLFAPGAIGETAVSTSGRTFTRITNGQSLIADLVEQGITGIKGYTNEPLLDAIASPSILFDRYTRGWSLIESYLAASRLVGWMDIVIGDPHTAPYADISLKGLKDLPK